MDAMDAMEGVVVEGGWRKGPWTAVEDRLLTEYVQQEGEGSWNSVAKLTGLRRSGKSCRLRWVNYLRPDLKRGKITADEEAVILQLHAMLGNRWSAIARCLPGRTDNEIKNYWRTHFKMARPSRRARAHLLHQHQLQQQRQYHHSLQLLHHHHHQVQLQLRQQEQELLELQLQLQLELQQQRPPEEEDVTMLISGGGGGGMQSSGSCVPCPAWTPDGLPADDDGDEELWESLWRLVDGDGDGTSGGDSGEC